MAEEFRAKAKTEGRGLGRVWESHLCQVSQVDLRDIWRGVPSARSKGIWVPREGSTTFQ